MDFFDLTKPLERIVVPRGTSHTHRKRAPDSDDESTCTTATGTDYVNKYVEEENKKYREVLSHLNIGIVFYR